MSLNQSKSTTKNLIAGGIAGAVEAAIMYPTEFIKTQVQLDAIKRSTDKNHPKLGYWECVRKTIHTHGVKGLYRGLSSLVIGSIPKASLRFGAFQKLSSLLQDKNGRLSNTNTMLAGLGAGAIEAIGAVAPMETIKTQFIADQNSSNPKYRGLVHGVSTMFKENGIRGIYRGVVATTLKQSCNQAVRFSIYTQLKQIMQKNSGKGSENFDVWKSVLAGSIAGFTSVYATMPFDVVKTQMQGFKYTSTLQCAKSIWSKSGLIAFWKGTVPRLGRVMCSSSIIFTSYEQIMKVMIVAWPEPDK